MGHRFTFGKDRRIHRPFEYKKIISEGRRVATRHFTLFFQRRTDNSKRIGISVGRRVGNAVVRNRIKRILRETFRVHNERIPQGVDIVVIVRYVEKNETLHTVSEEFFRALVKADL